MESQSVAPELERVHRRRRSGLAVAGIAAATVAITMVATRGPAGGPARVDQAIGRAGAPTTSGASSSGVTTTSPPIDVQLIASRSREVLGRTGRATVVFSSTTDDLPGVPGFTAGPGSGIVHLSFAGDDIEMTITFAGTDASLPDRGGFTTRNKTVGGEFYLYDGAPGDQHWVHDTNAAGGSAGDLFSIDPRTLLALFSDEAAFEQVGTETIDGVPTRHLRSTRSLAGTGLNLGLGPVGDGTIDVLELWVGDDDVARRVDIGTTHTLTTYSDAGLPLLSKNPDGSATITRSDGTVTVIPPGEPIIMPNPPASSGTAHEVRSTYSVTFSDLGEPITIEAPPDATDVAGVG